MRDVVTSSQGSLIATLLMAKKLLRPGEKKSSVGMGFTGKKPSVITPGRTLHSSRSLSAAIAALLPSMVTVTRASSRNFPTGRKFVRLTENWRSGSCNLRTLVVIQRDRTTSTGMTLMGKAYRLQSISRSFLEKGQSLPTRNLPKIQVGTFIT